MLLRLLCSKWILHAVESLAAKLFANVDNERPPPLWEVLEPQGKQQCHRCKQTLHLLHCRKRGERHFINFVECFCEPFFVVWHPPFDGFNEKCFLFLSCFAQIYWFSVSQSQLRRLMHTIMSECIVFGFLIPFSAWVDAFDINVAFLRFALCDAETRIVSAAE